MEQIKKEYYLVGGFTISKKILTVDNYCTRKNLVDIPSILKYYEVSKPKIKFYINSMNECVFISEYGEFESFKKMQEDYYNSSSTKTLYRKRYRSILDEIEKQFFLSIDEVDWIMTLNQGTETIDLSYIVLKDLNVNDKLNDFNIRQLIMLDTLMIYQSTMSIAKFFKSLSTKDELSKFEQYQISFYIQELKTLENPDFFLTNKDDIELTKLIYEKWNIEQQIKMTINIALQSLTVFE